MTVTTEVVASGISVATACTLTNPMDMVKVRLQLHRAALGDVLPAPGLVQTATQIVRDDGVMGLYKGVPPSALRAFTYGGLRLGMYGPIKTVLGDGKDAPFSIKLLAGSSAGGGAAVVSSPLELIKVRLQSKGNTHRGIMEVARAVIKADGITGLWKGSMPGMDGVGTHITSSMITGLVATTVTNPVDVVKTAAFVGGKAYKGMLDAVLRIAQQDGPLGFFKGWSANYLRLGPQTLIAFTVAEQLRKLAGVAAL